MQMGTPGLSLSIYSVYTPYKAVVVGILLPSTDMTLEEKKKRLKNKYAAPTPHRAALHAADTRDTGDENALNAPSWGLLVAVPRKYIACPVWQPELTLRSLVGRSLHHQSVFAGAS